jgi:hypothetical protein
LEQKQQVLTSQQKQLEGQVNRQGELAGMVSSIEAFCQRVRAGLTEATFEQKRALVELLIDRVLVDNGEVEIRYVIPTAPRGETTHFYQLRKDYFQVPLVTRPRAATTELIRIGLPKLATPLADGFVGDQHTTDKEELFDVPIAEAEAVVQPHTMTNDVGGKPMVFVALRDGWRRHAFSPSLAAYTMDHLAYRTGVIMPYGSRIGEDGKQVDSACYVYQRGRVVGRLQAQTWILIAWIVLYIVGLSETNTIGY